MSVAIIPMAQDFGWSPTAAGKRSLTLPLETRLPQPLPICAAAVTPGCRFRRLHPSFSLLPCHCAGIVQSSFFWGYLLSQIPGGYAASLFGGRTVLPAGVGLWSGELLGSTGLAA